MLLDELLKFSGRKFGMYPGRDPEEMEGIILCFSGVMVGMAVVRAAARLFGGRPVRGLGLGSFAGKIGVEDEGAGAALRSGPPPDVTESFDLALYLELRRLHGGAVDGARRYQSGRDGGTRAHVRGKGGTMAVDVVAVVVERTR